MVVLSRRRVITLNPFMSCVQKGRPWQITKNKIICGKTQESDMGPCAAYVKIFLFLVYKHRKSIPDTLDSWKWTCPIWNDTAVY